LVEIDFDPCVMLSMVDGMLTEIVVMHVKDNIFAGGSNLSKIVIEAPNYTLPTKHLGELTWTMRIDFERNRKVEIIDVAE